MEDPNRPVTGYPAPAHNPNPNGYAAANPPQSGTAYPYAAPPPTTGHYSYQNNPYNQQNYHQDPNSARRAIFLRRIFACIIGLIIILGTITFIVWLVLRPQLPEFRVDSFSVSNLTIGNNSLVSFASEVQLTARNPNKKMKLDYDHIGAEVFYKSDSLADTTIPPFYQDTKSETSIKANFVAAGSYVDKRVVDGINWDRSKNRNVGFNLRMISRVKFEVKAWRTRRRFLKVFCGDLVVGIPSNGRSGMLTSVTKQCRAGI